MKRATLPLLLVALALSSPCKAITVGQYVLTDLGDLPGGKDESYATGINSMGQVVGWSGTDTVSRGFLWTPNTPNSSIGTMIDLGTLRPDGQSYGGGINDRGEVVGFASGVPNSAFIWTPTMVNGTDGIMMPIGGAPFHDATTWPTSINSYGQVVGDGRTDNGTQIFMWMPDSPHAGTGSVVDLGITIVGYANANHHDLNHYGQVAGFGLNTNGIYQGFVWTPTHANASSGSLILLESPPSIYGQGETAATAINDQGRVVGSAAFVVVRNNGSVGVGHHAAMWIPTTPNDTTFVSAVDLGALYDQSYTSVAQAINSLGKVVGKGHAPGNDGYLTYHAFLWTPTTPNGTQGSMVDLNNLLSPEDRLHWIFSEATGINDLGQIIGNALYDADGKGGNPAVPRAFVLTPIPEPRAIALLANMVTLLTCNRVLGMRPGRR